jgi:hypothetical protein
MGPRLGRIALSQDKLSIEESKHDRHEDNFDLKEARTDTYLNFFFVRSDKTYSFLCPISRLLVHSLWQWSDFLSEPSLSTGTFYVNK